MEGLTVWLELLSECRRNFGSSPRYFSWIDRLTYWRVVRPEWLYQSPNDELETLFLNLRSLRRDGVVVWGHIIQANRLLYVPREGDCPAEIVFSLDYSREISPEALADVAHAVGSLKHTTPADPMAASIADYLINEWVRVYGKPVPQSVCPYNAFHISTIYIVRKHLPGPARILEKNFLPVIVLPYPPHIALALPSKYWPKKLLQWWNDLDSHFII